jgi:hypothetical protein
MKHPPSFLVMQKDLNKFCQPARGLRYDASDLRSDSAPQSFLTAPQSFRFFLFDLLLEFRGDRREISSSFI